MAKKPDTIMWRMAVLDAGDSIIINASATPRTMQRRALLTLWAVVIATGGALTDHSAPPPPPGNLNAQVDGTLVTASWEPTLGVAVSEFLMAVGTQSGASDVFSGSVGAATSVSANVPNGTYYWRVFAVSAGGTSAASAEAFFTVGCAAGGAAPGAPRNFAADVSGTHVLLSWNPPLGGGAVLTYVIEAGSSSGLADLYNAPTGGTLTSLSVEAPQGIYFVRIRARNPCATGSASNEQVIRVSRPPPAGCTYVTQPASAGFLPDGGVVDVRLDTGANCGWQMLADPWIVAEGQTTGTGPSTVRFRVAPSSGAYREGGVTIRGNDGRLAGVRVQITQSAEMLPACSYRLTPSAVELPPAGGSFEIALETAETCPWQVSSAPPWVEVLGGGGRGPARIGIVVGSNGTTFRSAVLSLAVSGGSLEVPVSQQPNGAPLVADFRPLSRCIGRLVLPFSIHLCTFDARVSSPLETIVSYTWTIGNLQFVRTGPLLEDVIVPGFGGGFQSAVKLTIRDSLGRQAEINRTILFDIPYGSAPPCTPGIPSVTSQAVPAAGGAFEVRFVDPQSYCAGDTWVPHVLGAAATWIRVTSPATFRGGGTVQYAVAPNFTGSARTGEIVFVTSHQGTFGSLQVTQVP